MTEKRMFDFEFVANQYNIEKTYSMKYYLIYEKSFPEMN